MPKNTHARLTEIKPKNNKDPKTNIVNNTYLRRNDMLKIMRLSYGTVYKLMRLNLFPKPIYLSDRLVAWLITDLNEWIKDQQKKGN